MRALAAVVTLALWSGLLALDPPPPPAHALSDRLSRALIAALRIQPGSPANRLLACGRSLGPTKCFSALSVWRAEKAIEILQNGREAQFNLREDVEQFPWEKYSNVSDERLYSQLYEDTERLLRYRSLSLTLPGYSLELDSKGNGTFNFDILKNNEADFKRSMGKKMTKQFYNIIPVLLLPGLIMSAILPFVLPALKLTTVAVGMLNNMALSGAVFTLLRNNAFNDHYEKKVIYVNEGYKNEKFSPLYFSKDFHKDFHIKDFHKGISLDHFDEYSGSASNMQPVMQNLEQPLQGDFPVDNLNAVQEAMNSDWINQYYGNVGFSDAGSLDNVNNFGSAGSVNSVSSASNSVNNIGSPNSVLISTVTDAPQTETKVRRSSKHRINTNRG